MTGEVPSKKIPKAAIHVDASLFVKIPVIGSVRCGEPTI